MIERSAPVRDLKADADLGRILSENLLVRHDDKTGGIIFLLIDSLVQDLQSVSLSRISAGDRRLCPVAFLCHLPRRKRIVRHADLAPIVLREESRALHQRLRMGVYRPDLLLLCPRNRQQTMFDADDLLPDDIILKFHQQIIDLTDDPRRGIRDPLPGNIGPALRDRRHGIAECIHMETLDLIPEKLPHGSLRIRTFRPLIHHSGILKIQTVHSDKW